MWKLTVRLKPSGPQYSLISVSSRFLNNLDSTSMSLGIQENVRENGPAVADLVVA